MNYHSIYDNPIVFSWTPNVPLEFFTAGRLYVLTGVSSHHFGTMQTDKNALIKKGALCVALGTAIDSFYKEKFAVLLVRDYVTGTPVEIRVRDNQFGRTLFKEV